MIFETDMVWCNKSDCITNTMTIETRYLCPNCHYERTLVHGTQWVHVDELHRFRRDILRGKYGEPARKWLAQLSRTACFSSQPDCFPATAATCFRPPNDFSLHAPDKPSWELPVHCRSCRAPCQPLIALPSSLPCTACGKKCLPV